MVDFVPTCKALIRHKEDHLTRWVLTQAALGVPPTHAQIREFASRVLQAQGATRTIVGKGWMTQFFRRNLVLLTQRGRKIDSARVNGATDPVIRSWFPLLNIPAIKDILPANRYNFDEFGLMEGQETNGLVVGNSRTRAVQKKVPGSRAWTSFLECVSATGVALPPAVIFKGKSIQQQWFPVAAQPSYPGAGPTEQGRGALVRDRLYCNDIELAGGKILQVSERETEDYIQCVAREPGFHRMQPALAVYSAHSRDIPDRQG